jgi:hypothetical protein
MRILWTLFKVILGLAIAIPVGILALALMAGVVGTLVGLAIVTLKLACLALVGYGLFRVARFMFAPAAKTPRAAPMREIPAVDPYYEAAMRDLDAEIERRPR